GIGLSRIVEKLLDNGEPCAYRGFTDFFLFLLQMLSVADFFTDLPPSWQRAGSLTGRPPRAAGTFPLCRAPRGRAESFHPYHGRTSHVQISRIAPEGFHADRAVGGDCDHRHPDRPARPRRPEGA